jgi:hypothetical protein
MRLEDEPSHKIYAKEDEKQANKKEHVVKGTHKSQGLRGPEGIERQFKTPFPKWVGPEVAFIAMGTLRQRPSQRNGVFTPCREIELGWPWAAPAVPENDHFRD